MQDPLELGAALDEAQECIKQGDPEKAEGILVSALHRWEDAYQSGAFQDSSTSEYHDFENPMEYYLYQMRSRPEKTVRQLPQPVALLYLAYGYTLYDLDRLDEAEAALVTARRWNPTSPQVMFELAEVYKKRGQLDRFWNLTLDALSLAYRRSQVSRGYRNLGYYFIEKQQWEDAIDFFFLALAYCPAEDEHGRQMIHEELLYINMQTNEDVNPPTEEEVQACCERHGIPIGVDESVLRLAYTLARQAKEAGAKSDALFFFQIVYGILRLDEIRKEIEELKK